MTLRRQIQAIELAGRLYSLIIDSSQQDGPCTALGLKEGTELYGPREFESQASAKKALHKWAFADAGVKDHRCDGNCAPWLAARPD